MPSNRRFVLSTVGISLLTRSTEHDLWGYMNESELPDDIRGIIDNAAQTALEKLRSGTTADRRRLSAELNGLYGLYDSQLDLGHTDEHMLLVTDTYVGESAGQVVAGFLREQGWSTVSHYRPPKLTTARTADFSQGMKSLINWCEEVIPGYRDAGYEVVFNLTGGFKSLQGYLTIVGMFYADRIVYIFETANELLTIPRLPIDLDQSVFREHRVKLALMAEGQALLPRAEVDGIPEGLLEQIDDVVGLSNWGLLAWNRLRAQILRGDLLEFPRLQYAPTFKDEFAKASSLERESLQRTLAQVSTLLEDGDGNISSLAHHSGLKYYNYTNRRTADGRPIGHFRLNRDRRASCVMQSNGTLLMRHFGAHNVVNNNP